MTGVQTCALPILYSVAPEYLPEGKTEYKFKASKERNDIPLQALRDCPALVDAKDREELEAYLAPFMRAVANSCSEDFDERSIRFDDEGNVLDTDEDILSEVEEMEEADADE